MNGNSETHEGSSPLEGTHPSLSTISPSKLLTALPDAIIAVDLRGAIRYVTEAAEWLTGYRRNELLGQPIEILVPVEARLEHVGKRSRFSEDLVNRPMGVSLSITLLCKDGELIPVDVGLGSVEVRGENWVIAAIRDDSARREAEKARSELEEHYRIAFESNMAPMIFIDLDGQIFAANNAFCQMIGQSREDVLFRDSSFFTHPDDIGVTEEIHQRVSAGEIDRVSYVKRYLHRDGRVITVEVSKAAARDAAGRTLYYVVSERDLTDEQALAAQLSHQALHDPLTGLANRALFEDRLTHAHAKAGREGAVGAVLLMDLDDFKGINDTYGHLVGDQLLITIARRLERVTRSCDTLCRFGGDEFLYLAEGLISPEEAEEIGVRLLDAIAEPLSIEGISIEQRASVGISLWDGMSGDLNEVIRKADVAMYEAKKKRGGTSHHVIFAPGLHDQAISRFALIQELRQALHAGEITMHYQPIVELDTAHVVGFEALMRWRHSERGWIPPDVFIPIAEQSDLILELGHYALREATRVASSWERMGNLISQCFVTVNLSAHQFQDPDLVAIIEEVLTAGGIAPGRLILEITESVTLNNVEETKLTIEKLRKRGVAIALDDFGTGYTSLAYLMDLDPRIIKIDRSFVSHDSDDAHGRMMLETVVSLGNKFNVVMLGEGIETREQLDELRSYGCALGQGYLFSPAVPASEIHAVVERLSRGSS